jgi:hypothetical protein
MSTDISSPANMNLLELDDTDEKLLKELKKLEEDDLLEHLRDLRAERIFEYNIYATREQWLWIPWTTCLAAAILALTAPWAVVRIGTSIITGLFALLVAYRRRPGLLASYNALSIRHKWVIALTRCNKDSSCPRLKTRGFDDRIVSGKGGNPIDQIHIEGFRYPLDAIKWTLCAWIPLILLALLSCFLRWPAN